MLKRTLLAGSTLAIVVLLFVVYQWQDPTPAPPLPEPLAPVAPTTQKTSDEEFIRVRDVEVPPGKQSVHVGYDRQGREKIRFRSEEWRPISENELHITKLEARLLLPGTQLVYVTADEGQVVLAGEENNNYEPRRGWVRGHVHIMVDQTTERWRVAHPDRALPEQHPEYIVNLWLDRLHFDLDLARLESESDLVVESQEATIEGTGIVLAWNEVDRRIERLDIPKGKQIVLRRNADLIQFSMPGTERVRAVPKRMVQGGASPVSNEKPAKSKPTDLLSEDPLADSGTLPPVEGEELFLDMTRARRLQRGPDKIDTYLADFKGGVVVEQRSGETVTGRLVADALQILFDVGAERRAMAEVDRDNSQRQRPTTQPIVPDAAEKQPESHVVLVWHGPLHLVPVAADKKTQTGKRIDVTATGNVHVTKGEAGAVCKKLVFHNESQQAEMYGSPVRLHRSPTQWMEGEQITFDRQGGTARVIGPGEMVDKMGLSRAIAAADESPVDRPPGQPGEAAEQPARVAWSQGVELSFGTVEQPRYDARSGQAVVAQRDYIKRARYLGDVQMSRGEQSLDADDIELVFRAPDSGANGGLRDSIEMAIARLRDEPPEAKRDADAQLDRMIARGHVRYANHDPVQPERSGIVTADELTVEMTVDDEGRNIPARAEARGNAVARQEERFISARDRLAITFGNVADPLPPLDRQAAARALRARGIDPQTIDWEARDERRRQHQRLDITYLEGYGQVAGGDPADAMAISAETLRAWMPEGRQRLERALLVGTPDRPAQADREGYFIRGPKITLDVSRQYAAVPSAGMMRFLSRDGLDGRPLDEPVPIVVTWSDNMVMNGHENQGVFHGAVHAVSRNDVLDCDQLHISFADVPETTKASADRKASSRPSLWIFDPLIDRVEAGTSKQSDRPKPLGNIRKRPVYLLAVGNARVSTTTTDKDEPSRILTRMHLDGPQLSVDLDADQLSVTGAGHLLIEDRRLPTAEMRAARARAPEPSNPFGTQLGMEGPSWTVFSWENAMSYFARRNLAVLDRGVTMVHLAGREMKLSPEQATAMGLDLAKLASAPGRRAFLQSDNLVVQFVRGQRPADDPTDPAQLASATELRHLCATGNARLQEGRRSVEGQIITFNRSTNFINVIRSVDEPAKVVIAVDERTGRYQVVTGDSLTYNIESGQFEGQRMHVQSTGG